MTGLAGSVLTMVRLLADDPPAEIDPTTGKGPEWGKAAPIGLLIILLMGIALYFLIKSMNKNLRKVPSSFEADLPDADVADDGGDAEFSSAGSADHDPNIDPNIDPDLDRDLDPDLDSDEPLAGTAADHAERPR